MTSKYRFCLMCLCCLLCFSLASAQHKQAYALFNQQGKQQDYKQLIDSLAMADVVLFGEFHNSAIAHWLELEIVKSLHTKNIRLQLGAEMFEADQQEAINAYLSGRLDANQLKDSLTLWSNFKTDYKPFLDYAKQQQLGFTATNIPRRFANDVYKKGGFKALDSLSTNQLKWVAPLPIAFDPELPGYKNMLEMMGGHGSLDMVKAQAIKDATMAYFIGQMLKPNRVFFHLNGSYHSNNFEGIYWYLKQNQPDLNILTLSTVEQAELTILEKEHTHLANFIICVDEDVTKTY